MQTLETFSNDWFISETTAEWQQWNTVHAGPCVLFLWSIIFYVNLISGIISKIHLNLLETDFDESTIKMDLILGKELMLWCYMILTLCSYNLLLLGRRMYWLHNSIQTRINLICSEANYEIYHAQILPPINKTFKIWDLQ